MPTGPRRRRVPPRSWRLPLPRKCSVLASPFQVAMCLVGITDDHDDHHPTTAPGAPFGVGAKRALDEVGPRGPGGLAGALAAKRAHCTLACRGSVGCSATPWRAPARLSPSPSSRTSTRCAASSRTPGCPPRCTGRQAHAPYLPGPRDPALPIPLTRGRFLLCDEGKPVTTTSPDLVGIEACRRHQAPSTVPAATCRSALASPASRATTGPASQRGKDVLRARCNAAKTRERQRRTSSSPGEVCSSARPTASVRTGIQISVVSAHLGHGYGRPNAVFQGAGQVPAPKP